MAEADVSSYVRSIDEALMIEVAPHCFVAEQYLIRFEPIAKPKPVKKPRKPKGNGRSD